MELIGAHGLEVGKVKAELLVVDVGAGLVNVGTENFAQRPMEDVGRRVVTLNVATAGHIEGELNGFSLGRIKVMAIDGDFVQVPLGIVLNRIDDRKVITIDTNLAAVTDLATHFGIKGGLLKEEKGMAFFCRKDGSDLAIEVFPVFRVVAHKLSLR